MPALWLDVDPPAWGSQKARKEMKRLLVVEKEAFARLAVGLGEVVEHPPSTPLAVEPLERQLYKLGYATGVTHALAAFTDYRAALALAMKEEAGA